MTSTRVEFSFKHWLILTFLGVLSGLLFFVLAGIPLVALRRVCGRAGLWAGALLISAILTVLGFGPAAAMTVILAFLVALYAELRSIHFTPSRAGLLALVGATGAMGSAIYVWVQSMGWDLVMTFKARVFELAGQLLSSQPNLNINMESAWLQLPAALVIALGASLAVGLIFESRLVNRLNQNIHDDETLRLYEFRNSDVLIWLSIAGVLGAFLELNMPTLQIISLNVFYVLVFLYFLQGVAIVATFFAIMRVAPVWQWLWYLVLVMQLLPLVSFIGFADYWIGFRERIIRRTSEGKRGSI